MPKKSIGDKFDAVDLDVASEKASVGEPMFTHADVLATPYILDRLVRGVCVKNRISRQYLQEMYVKYALETLGLTPKQASDGKQNIVKNLRKQNITPLVFFRTLRALDFDLEDITITVSERKSGKKVVVSLQDIEDAAVVATRTHVKNNCE
jgi:hypothetical protein